MSEDMQLLLPIPKQDTTVDCIHCASVTDAGFVTCDQCVTRLVEERMQALRAAVVTLLPYLVLSPYPMPTDWDGVSRTCRICGEDAAHVKDCPVDALERAAGLKGKA